ncbi:SGNH/GDSL hydrolase family protein [Niallia sp. 01092]|uniref:SGNH/GDSL hydrolase family protein n=1 Tax=unclassified Niallia TaxID=2837522 RepID=UPI003FD5074D
MKKSSLFLIICLSLLLATSCSKDAVLQYNGVKETMVVNKENIPETFFPQDVKIVSAGDSLTQGVGDSTGKGGYIPYLTRLLEQDRGIGEVTIENYGVKGNKTDQLLKKIKTKEVNQSIAAADMVILTIGGNDMMKVIRDHLSDLQLDDFSQQKKLYESNLHEVLKTIRTYNPNALIVLVGVYNPFTKWFSNIDELNQVVAEWNTTGENILTLFDQTYFVRIDDIFSNDKENLLFKDYFHPNDKGYQLIADKIYKKLKEQAISVILTKRTTEEEGRGE